MPPELGHIQAATKLVLTAPSYFHLHLVSDATGETLTIMAKAAAVQYGQIRAITPV